MSIKFYTTLLSYELLAVSCELRARKNASSAGVLYS